MYIGLSQLNTHHILAHTHIVNPHSLTLMKHFCMATMTEPRAMVMRFTQGVQSCSSYVTSSTKETGFGYGTVAEMLHVISPPIKMSTFPANLLSISRRDNTTCSQSVRPIQNFAEAQPQKLYSTRER